MPKKILLTIALAVAVAIVPVLARADNTVTNQWYTGSFSATDDTPLLAGPAEGYSSNLGFDGPVLPSGTGTAIAAPGISGNLSMTITLPTGGYLTVTDVEGAGDQFQMLNKGSPASLALAGASGLSPAGQNSYNGTAVDGIYYEGLTSLPVLYGAPYDSEDIGGALATSAFSSGTFYLPPGTDTITGNFLRGIGGGDMDLIVEPASVPEPATMLLLGSGLLGLAGLWRKFKK
jgi:hypothetical protein